MKVMWQSLPDELLLRVFSRLSDYDLLNAGVTCLRWFRVSRDNLLWKERVYKKYAPTQLLDSSLKPFGVELQSSFFSVYKSFEQEVPRVCVQTVAFHQDEVLHVSFSNNGQYVCSSSKDAKAAIWSLSSQLQLERYDVINFTDRHLVTVPWRHVQYSKFNSDDTLLLLSACGLLGNNSKGQIAVYDVQLKQMIQLYNNHPYDLLGTWLDDLTVVHGNIRFLGQSITETILSVSNVQTNKVHLTKEIGRFRCNNGAYLRQLHGLNIGLTIGCEYGDQYEADQCQALLYTRGEQYHSPHQLGCYVIASVGIYSALEKQSSVIEFNGNIIGYAISPDQQYLYVNCRPFTDEHVDPGPFASPSILSNVVMRVYHLKSPMEWKHVQTLSGHCCFTDAHNCFFIYLDVEKQYVASGAEDKRVHIWHRQSGARVACLTGHNDVVNSVAFNPSNPGMLVSGSDDYTMKVWLSKKLARPHSSVPNGH